ncbi:CBS domain-containing protein [Streptomyces sp. URMC 129]|uniref:CBS domain-containing protein n=1 Tax=Streptomyces sp. URMC 129 TaxID=3423407 RepID=UPI003F1BC78F
MEPACCTRTAGDALGSVGPRVWEDMTVDVALSVLDGARVGHLIICDGDGRCTGLVTRAQLTVTAGDPWYAERTRLRDIVHDQGPFTRSATPLHDAERAMRDRRLCDSPVVDDDGYALGVLALAR